MYDREAVLGRDTSSVFPSQSQDTARANAETTKAALGAMKFVSESQVLMTSSIRLLHLARSLSAEVRPLAKADAVRFPAVRGAEGGKRR